MKDAPKPPETGPVEGLSRSDSLWRVGDRPLTLQDTNEIQLLLRGQDFDPLLFQNVFVEDIDRNPLLKMRGNQKEKDRFGQMPFRTQGP